MKVRVTLSLDQDELKYPDQLAAQARRFFAQEKTKEEEEKERAAWDRASLEVLAHDEDGMTTM
jgi:hypothetical protein